MTDFAKEIESEIRLDGVFALFEAADDEAEARLRKRWKRRREINRRIGDESDRYTGYNPFTWIADRYNRWREVAALKSERNELRRAQGQDRAGMAVLARLALEKAGALAVSGTPLEPARTVLVDAAATAEKARDLAADLKSCSATALEELGEAQSACHSAAAMAAMDAFSKNKGVNLLSFCAATTAGSEIDEAKEALETLRSRMEEAKKNGLISDTGLGGGLMTTATMDFIFGLSDGALGTFGAIMGMASASSAASRLGDAIETLEPIDAKLGEELEGLEGHFKDATAARESHDAARLEQEARSNPRARRFLDRLPHHGLRAAPPKSAPPRKPGP